MATRGAVLRGAMSIPGGARPTPAPQGGGMNFSGGRALNAPSIGQPSPLAAQLANEGGGYTRMYGGFLPRPTGDFTAGAFGPFSPILPVPVDEPPEGAVRPEARRFEYQVGWNLPVGQPGQEGLRLTSFETMRRLADVYSVARACIEYRKNQVKGIDWDIIPTPEATKAYQQSPGLMADFGKRRAKALKFFKKPDQDYMTFGTWISVVVEELLVYDALSLLMRPVRGKGRGKGVLGSDFASFMTVHGPTIRPLLDLHGGTPRPPAPAYQQYLYGVPRSDYLTMITQDDIDDAGLAGSEVGSFRGDQLLYLPSVPRAWTPYGFSAIERALIPIMTGLQKQGFQYDWFAESTVPSAYVIPGDTAMTPNQLRELQDALNAIAGDPAWKQKIIVLPPGSHVEPQRPGAPADELDQLLFTETCMAFGLSPMEIGVTPARSSSMGAQNQMAKMSQKTSEDAGLTPILKFFQDIFNLILQQVCNQEDMLFTFEGLQEEEDVESLTGVLVQQVQNGLRTVDEARQELNMQPYGLEETTEPLFVTPNGPVPLSTAIKNAESAAAQQEAQAQQTQAGVIQTHANVAQSLAGMAATQAGTEATQQNTEVARSRLQMQQEQHEVSMNEPGAGQMQERSQDHQAGMATQAQLHQAGMATQAQEHQSAMAQQAQRAQAQQATAKDGKPTPGHAAARASNREAANTKKSFDPVLVKRQAAEYGALVRHLNKGRPVSTWEAKFVSEAVLADVAKGMAHGLAPSDAVSAAKARAEVQLAPSEYEWVTHQVGDRLVTTHNGAVKVADAGPKAGEFDVQKAAGPNKTWPGWQRDVELVQHYVPKITQAFQDGMAAARAFLNSLFSGQIRVTATWAAQEIRNIMAAAMRRALGPLWTEGYALGRASAVSVVTGLLDWGNWEPGDVDAAALVADGPGLKRLLEQWGINVIQSISETRMDDLAQQIAQALVDGDSPDTLAHNIEDMLNVPRRARMIAQTELARAVTVATLDTYNETGVERKQWLIAPDESVCLKCRAAEAEGAIPLTQAFEATGKDGPPAHPHCRCTTIPADTHGFDLSDMVSEPLPDFATVPLVPAMAKRARIVYCDQGHKHHGPGAAGVLIRAPRPDGTMAYLLQQRDKTADQPFTWSTFGGTLHVGESPRDGAMREVEEESGVKPGDYQLGPKVVDDHGKWAYTTYIADAPKAFWPSFDGSTPEETVDWGWFTRDEMQDLDLHPAFEAKLDELLRIEKRFNPLEPRDESGKWVFRGSPKIGTKVYHNDHGLGRVTTSDDASITVEFPSGTRSYPKMGKKSGTPMHFERVAGVTASTTVTKPVNRRANAPRLYHGTGQKMSPGDLITAGKKPSPFSHLSRPGYTYLTDSPRSAVRWSRGSIFFKVPDPHVYEVEPVGSYGDDPRSGSGNYRSKSPLRVIREVPFSQASAQSHSVSMFDKTVEDDPLYIGHDDEYDDDAQRFEEQFYGYDDRIEKVGPKGYIHGWIKVGADGKPLAGYEAASPDDVKHGDVIRVAVHHNEHKGTTAVEPEQDVPDDADERLLHVDKVVNGIAYSGHDENGVQHSLIMPDGNVQRVIGKPTRPAEPEAVEKPEEARARLDAVVHNLGAPKKPSFVHRPFDPRVDGWGNPQLASSIESYISLDGNRVINGGLRKLHPGEKLLDDPDQRSAMAQPSKQVEMLDENVSQTVLSKPAVVYRGFTAPQSALDQLVPGQEFDDHAYVSTSFTAKWAASFALLRAYGYDEDISSNVTAHGGKPVIMKINVPVGGHMFQGEKDIGEYVLPRNTKFRVTDVSHDGSLITVDVLPEGDTT